MNKIVKTTLEEFQNCLLLTNGTVEVTVSADFGPRILAYNFVGGENVLGLHPAAQVETEFGLWKPYGGHRLWIAPENMPLSYVPDNDPVEWFFDEENNSLRMRQFDDKFTQIEKELTVTLDKEGSGITLDHKLTNRGETEIEGAVWALTIMRDGGEVFIPNETFMPYSPQTLLPVRNLTLWSYTDLTDSRWRFGSDFIKFKVDREKETQQKIGVLNKQGWVRYELAEIGFTKQFNHLENKTYPDLNSNTEVYCAGSFVEIETLSPLENIAAGDFIEHRERWTVEKK